MVNSTMNDQVSNHSSQYRTNTNRQSILYKKFKYIFVILSVVTGIIIYVIGHKIFPRYCVSINDYKETFLTKRLRNSDKSMFCKQWKFVQLNIDDDMNTKKACLYRFLQGNIRTMNTIYDRHSTALEYAYDEAEKTKIKNEFEITWQIFLKYEIKFSTHEDYYFDRANGVLNNYMCFYYSENQDEILSYFDYFESYDMSKTYIVEYLVWRSRFPILREQHLKSYVALGVITNDTKNAKYKNNELEKPIDKMNVIKICLEYVPPKSVLKMINSLFSLIGLLHNEYENFSYKLFSKDKDNKVVLYKYFENTLKKTIECLGLKNAISEDDIKNELCKMGMALPSVFTNIIYSHFFEIFYLLTLDVKIGEYEDIKARKLYPMLYGDDVKLMKLKENKNIKLPNQPLEDFDVKRYEYVANVFSILVSTIYGRKYNESQKNISKLHKIMRFFFGNHIMSTEEYDKIFDDYYNIYIALYTQLMYVVGKI